MYNFNFRRALSSCLILALLLVVLLFCFVPFVSASESQMYLYNGVELPALPEWDHTAYPYAYISYEFSTSGEVGETYWVFFSDRPFSFDGSYQIFTSPPTYASWEYLNNSWVYFNTYQEDNSKLRFFGSLVWSNFDILGGDLSTVYLAASDPVPVGGPTGAEQPVFTVQPPFVTWVEYNVGDTPDPVTVEAVVTDGGTLSYVWYRNIYTDSGILTGEFSVGPTLIPDTSAVSDSSYYCVATNTNGQYSYPGYSNFYRVKVFESGAADPPAETPSYPSADEIGSSVGDAYQNVIDQSDINASQQGSSFVDQITQIVPNESQGFINAMGGLVDSLSYGGTECVLTIPALAMPQIGELVPQYTLLEEQEVDLESYFDMFPDFIVTLVRSLFTVALIVFCFKELYATISYFFVLRGGET